jgi:hypothetical protein
MDLIQFWGSGTLDPEHCVYAVLLAKGFIIWISFLLYLDRIMDK